jgi:hypothetical protein
VDVKVLLISLTVVFVIVAAFIGPSDNKQPVIYIQETTTDSGTKCVVASSDSSIALTCNWNVVKTY